MLTHSGKHVDPASHSTYVSIKEKKLTYYSGPILHSHFFSISNLCLFLLIHVHLRAHTHTHTPQLDVPDLYLKITMTLPTGRIYFSQVKKNDSLLYQIYFQHTLYRKYINFLGTPLQYSCLENPMDGGAWLQSMGLLRVGHD